MVCRGIVSGSAAPRQIAHRKLVRDGVELTRLGPAVFNGRRPHSKLGTMQERYLITSDVLGDKFHAILYDSCRRCVFDDQGNLLQVGFRRSFSYWDVAIRCGVSEK
jgi:hypothetical protein